MKDTIYHKEEIISALQENSLGLIKWISEQDNDTFGVSQDEKVEHRPAAKSSYEIDKPFGEDFE